MSSDDVSNMKIVSVLFLCTGNSARSQMAEAFLRRFGDDAYDSFSAGIEPATLNPFTRRVMDEIGFDLAGHYSKNIKEFIDTVQFDYLITVCDDADQNCPVFPGSGERIHWSFQDPAAFNGSEDETLNEFREVRDLIQEKVLSWVLERGTASEIS